MVHGEGYEQYFDVLLLPLIVKLIKHEQMGLRKVVPVDVFHIIILCIGAYFSVSNQRAHDRISWYRLQHKKSLDKTKYKLKKIVSPMLVYNKSF